MSSAIGKMKSKGLSWSVFPLTLVWILEAKATNLEGCTRRGPIGANLSKAGVSELASSDICLGFGICVLWGRFQSCSRECRRWLLQVWPIPRCCGWRLQALPWEKVLALDERNSDGSHLLIWKCFKGLFWNRDCFVWTRVARWFVPHRGAHWDFQLTVEVSTYSISSRILLSDYLRFFSMILIV